ncbi:MAG: acyl-CoA reductase, partial [Limisphaerales bacterium]
EDAAAIASRRGIYEVRAAHSPELTRHFCSQDSTAWTVIFEADARFQLSCLNRFIYVKPVADLRTALENADVVRGKVSTVGIAAPEEKISELATQLANWGATRICPLGQMQNPPLTWRHDGRPVLGDFITWTDFEKEF